MSFWKNCLDQNTTEKFDRFCPQTFRAESIKFFGGILFQTIFSKRHFEINWPLGSSQICTDFSQSFIVRKFFLYSFQVLWIQAEFSIFLWWVGLWKNVDRISQRPRIFKRSRCVHRFGLCVLNFISSLMRETDTTMTRAKSWANCKTLIFLKDKLTKTPILPNFRVPTRSMVL